MSGTDTVLVSEIIPATRERIYAAWLDSRQHSDFTGDEATIEPTVGGKHTAFGGYASGRNIELEPYRRIVQTWRSTEFPDGSPDSRVEVTLEETGGGTLVTLLHTDIPAGQADRYREGWLKFYLEPLKRYFGKRVTNGVNGRRHGSFEHAHTVPAMTPELAAKAGSKPRKAKVKAKAKAAAVKARPKTKAKPRPAQASKQASKPAGKRRSKAAPRKPAAKKKPRKR